MFTWEGGVKAEFDRVGMWDTFTCKFFVFI